MIFKILNLINKSIQEIRLDVFEVAFSLFTIIAQMYDFLRAILLNGLLRNCLQIHQYFLNLSLNKFNESYYPKAHFLLVLAKQSRHLYHLLPKPRLLT